MGPLEGVRIVEFAGVGPGPMCAMLLADMGATVLRLDRTAPAKLGVERPVEFNFILRNRQTLALDLKNEADVKLAKELVDRADAVIEGFRPGVMERLGLGPDECLNRNPKLVYGRITGWGQTGPLAQLAGHDLNYIALTGAAAAIGRRGELPAPPLNLVGDFAGGGLYLALGILAALHEANRSKKGQVIDASIVDGSLSMMMQFYGMKAAGLWNLERGSNILDSGAPFYDVYKCADGRLISIAPIEDKFFDEFLTKAGLPAECMAMKRDRRRWDELRELMTKTFASRDSKYWLDILEGSDACYAPVLTMEEAPLHPHLVARKSFVEVGGQLHPAPQPLFSRTPSDKPSPPKVADPADREAILREWLPEAATK